MSRLAWLDLHYAGPQLKPSTLIARLLDHGWNMNDHGKITALRFGDREAFNWYSFEICELPAVWDEIGKKEDSGERVGVVLLWKDTGVGMTSILDPRQGLISCSLNVARRVIAGCKTVSDASWYVERIVPALEVDDLRVTRIEWVDSE